MAVEYKPHFLRRLIYEFYLKNGLRFYSFSKSEMVDSVYSDNSLISGFFEHFLAHYFVNLKKTHRTCHYDFEDDEGKKYELKFTGKHYQKLKNDTSMSKVAYLQTGYHRLKSISKDKKEKYLEKQKDIDYFMIADISVFGLISLHTVEYKKIKEHLSKKNPTQIKFKEVELLTKQCKRYRLI